ncbi:MAG: hypothetical protein H5T59_07795 [Anaerolineae bacterium]|nr:hypothetical protein [Anaerolineae bacterium]
MTRIGEIVATHSLGFVAESFALHQPPPLGSLVKAPLVAGGEALGVVCFGETVGVQPGRRALRRSDEAVYDSAVYDEHPELRHTIRTEFHVALVGWQEGAAIHQVLPPQPPPLHYSVLQCPPEEVRAFTERLAYFRLLLAAETPLPGEQLLAAHIRRAHADRGEDEAWLRRAAREVARLLKEDYDRLVTVLSGIAPEGG